MSDNLMSAKLLVPIDQDFPLLGGKTLRVTGGLEVAVEQIRVDRHHRRAGDSLRLGSPMGPPTHR